MRDVLMLHLLCVDFLAQPSRLRWLDWAGLKDGARNAQIGAYQASDAPLNEKVAYLFGLRQRGVVDENFKGTIRALCRQTDDCIFFSKLLTADLADHGERLRSIFKSRFGRDAPRINRVLWDDVEKRGLLPPESEYATWISGFLRRVPKSYGRRREMVRYRLRRTFGRAPLGRVIAAFRRWLAKK